MPGVPTVLSNFGHNKLTEESGVHNLTVTDLDAPFIRCDLISLLLNPDPADFNRSQTGRLNGYSFIVLAVNYFIHFFTVIHLLY